MRNPGSWFVVAASLLTSACDTPIFGDAGPDNGLADRVQLEAGSDPDAMDSAIDGGDAVLDDARDARDVALDAFDAAADSSVDTLVASDGSDATDVAPVDAFDVVTGDAGPGWSCLGHVTADTPQGASVTLTLNVNDFQTGTGIAGASVKACRRDDLTCATSVASGTTTPAGDVIFVLPTAGGGWNGYFEITGAGVYPTRYFIVVPITALTASTSTAVLSSMAVDGFAAAIGVTLDAALGHIASNTFDCTGTTAAGVVLSMAPPSARSTAYYLAGMAPSIAATTTDQSGVGGFLNVAPGSETVTARIGGDWVGATTISVRAGFMSTFGMRPMPRM